MLANVKKRRIYDKYGETGLLVLANLKSTSVTEFILNTGRLKIVYSTILAIIIFLALFPILVALRVDHVITISWRLVFAPLWIFDVVTFWLALVVLFLNWNYIYGQSADEMVDDAEEVLSSGRMNKTILVASVVLVLIFLGIILMQQLFLALWLDGIIRWSLWGVLFPYLFLEVVLNVWNCVSISYVITEWNSSMGLNMVSDEQRSLPYARLYYAFRNLRSSTARLLTAALVLLRVQSGFRGITWRLITAPFMVSLVLSFAVDAVMAHRLMVRATKEYTDESSLSPRAKYLLMYIPYGLGVLLSVSFLASVNVRLSRIDAGLPLGRSFAIVLVHVVSVLLIVVLLIAGWFGYTIIPDFEKMREHMGAFPHQSSSSSGGLSDDLPEGKSPPRSDAEAILRSAGFPMGPPQRRILEQ